MPMDLGTRKRAISGHNAPGPAKCSVRVGDDAAEAISEMPVAGWAYFCGLELLALGTFVVRDGKLQEGVALGQAIRAH